MQILSRLSLLLIPLLAISCATPAEVKKLSVAQIGYFDTAIEAVKLQSEALIMAAEKIKADAEQRINQRQQERTKRIEDAIVDEISKLDREQRKTEMKRLLADAEKGNRSAEEARAKLAGDLEAIKAKTGELHNYIAKMRDVQVALDAYLQSEKAGEQITQTVLSQPTVESLISTVNDLSPKVTRTITDLSRLIGGLK